MGGVFIARGVGCRYPFYEPISQGSSVVEDERWAVCSQFCLRESSMDIERKK